MNSFLRPCRCPLVPGLALLLAIAPALRAQNNPRIGYVYPAGGQQGTMFQVTVSGQFLNGTTNAYVSGIGVQGTVIGYTRPLNQKEVNDLREKSKELQDKRAAFQASRRGGAPTTPTNVVWTAADQKMLADIRQKLADWQRRRDNPALAETVTLRITIAPNAETGQRELRLAKPAGLSNPLVFCVGELPEFAEPESHNNVEPAGPPPSRSNDGPRSAAPTPMNITLPATVNGQILPGGVDRYRFEARQGQRLLVAARARRLIPYLADAVPGWFQATIALYDAQNREVDYADHFRFQPDPVLLYEIPADGRYALEIRDSIYRGREDFVYRVTVGELPFVTSVFPLGGRVGAPITVEMRGWNLPVDHWTMDLKNTRPGSYPISVSNQGRRSNRVPFAVDTLPEVIETEPDNSPTNAQTVTLPAIINGRIDPPGDADLFQFEARAGDEIVAEVYARRLDTPLDSVLRLTDAAGRQLAFNDDHEDKGSGLNTHHADSWLRATMPADGTYCLRIGDTQGKGGPEFGYRLRVGPPLPDFALRIVPSSLTVRAGLSVPLTAYALRNDGYNGEIVLALRDAPPGFRLTGARIPSNQDQVRFTLTAPPAPRREPFNLVLEGHAMIREYEIVRRAVPAEDMMQAFAYRHLVPAQELKALVMGRSMPAAPVKILGPTPLRISAGGTARLPVTVLPNAFAGKVDLELNNPPEGITIQNISSVGETSEITFQTDAAKIKPGLRGNLIVDILVTRPPGPEGRGPANQRSPVATLPAIPFEIVPR